MNTDSQTTKQPTLRSAAWLLFFVFLLRFLVPLALEQLGDFPSWGVSLSINVLAIAVPSLLYLLFFSLNSQKTLKIHKISFSNAFFCVIIGISAQTVASLLNVPGLLLLDKLGISAPPPASVSTGLIPSLLVTALVPAVFEEVLMRGIVLSATQPRGYRASLVIGAVYFSLLHARLDSLLGLAFLGMTLVFVVWMTQSIFAGMLAHLAFNAFGLILDFYVNANAAGMPFLTSVWFQIALVTASLLVYCVAVSHIGRLHTYKNKTKNLAYQLFQAFCNIPIFLLLAGYIALEAIRLHLF